MLQHTPDFSAIPMLGVCAAGSGMGKTTLLEAMLPLLAANGVQTAIIKQARADFDVDQPGKDSHRMRQAGASQVLVSSPGRWVLMTELDEPDTANDGDNLYQLAANFDPALTDLVLVEGYRNASIPKIEVFRASRGRPLLAPQDPYIIAVASDQPVVAALPWLDLNQPTQVADFILSWLASHGQLELRPIQAPWRANA